MRYSPPNLLKEALFPTLLKQFGFDEPTTGEFLPQSQNSYSLSEDQNHLFVEIPMPGMEISDIQMTFDKGILRVQGEANEEKVDPMRSYYKRAHYNYSFALALPGEIDETQEPEAHYERGILYVEFAKVSPSEPKKIEIKKR